MAAKRKSAPKSVEPQGRGSRTIAIPVCWDVDSATLSIEQPKVTAQWGDNLLFEIEGLPETWITAFRLHASRPFHQVVRSTRRTRTGILVELERDGEATELLYFLRAQQGLGVGDDVPTTVAWSAQAVLDLLPFRGAQEREFRVRLEDDELVVEPDLVRVAPGDSVVWDFSAIDLPPNTTPMVIFRRFYGPNQEGLRNSSLGPFTSSMTEANRIRSAGNNSLRGSYFFKVAVVNHGEGGIVWLSSTDPVVDNQGEPIGPGSG